MGVFMDMTIKVYDRVESLVSVFNDIYSMNIEVPASFFDLKGAASGRCCFDFESMKGYLQFNKVLMIENWERFDNTIIHEVAHYCVDFLYKGRVKSHGKEWKKVMLLLGGNPNRCHTYDTSNVVRSRVRQRYKYACACGEHMVSDVRHNRMQEGKQRYRCGVCKAEIKYVG